MQKTVLSTADVARLFKVTETTVKRWADSGTLRCQKTPGGHRKFEIRNVVEFAEKTHFEPFGVLEYPVDDATREKVERATLGRDFPTLTEIFVERALSPDRNDLYLFLSFLYEHRFHLWEIYDLVLRSGMAEIGDRWASGRISVSHEHRATHETLEALARLQAEVLVKPPKEETALLACLGEEYHEIGLRCASYIFDSEGWTTQYLGAYTPHDALLSSIRELKPSLVCLSFSRDQQFNQVRPLLDGLAAAARTHGSRLIAGGRIAEGGTLDNGFFDAVLTSSHDLQQYIERFGLQADQSPSGSNAPLSA